MAVLQRAVDALPRRMAAPDVRKCVGCGRCQKRCEWVAAKVVDEKARIDPAKCIGCGACRRICPTKAIELFDIRKEPLRFLANVDSERCIGPACLGVCRMKAIAVVGGKARVNFGECIGCGACTRVCRQKAIFLVGIPPKPSPRNIPWPNPGKCVGCEACQRICPTAAIKVVGGKALVDLRRCIGCGQCAKACPRKTVFLAKFVTKPLKKVAFSDPKKCPGCRMCEGVCPLGAITVEGGKAKVDILKCTGCGACQGACPAKAMMVGYAFPA